MRLNIKHQRSGYNGDLVWSGQSFHLVQVENISRNAKVEVGDTIVTNQFSKSLPESTPVGIIEQINFDAAGNFYRLDVQPLADFRKLNYVYVVKRKDLDEIENLEQNVAE